MYKMLRLGLVRWFMRLKVLAPGKSDNLTFVPGPTWSTACPLTPMCVLWGMSKEHFHTGSR